MTDVTDVPDLPEFNWLTFIQKIRDQVNARCQVAMIVADGKHADSHVMVRVLVTSTPQYLAVTKQISQIFIHSEYDPYRIAHDIAQEVNSEVRNEYLSEKESQ